MGWSAKNELLDPDDSGRIGIDPLGVALRETRRGGRPALERPTLGDRAVAEV